MTGENGNNGKKDFASSADVTKMREEMQQNFHMFMGIGSAILAIFFLVLMWGYMPNFIGSAAASHMQNYWQINNIDTESIRPIVKLVVSTETRTRLLDALDGQPAGAAGAGVAAVPATGLQHVACAPPGGGGGMADPRGCFTELRRIIALKAWYDRGA